MLTMDKIFLFILLVLLVATLSLRVAAAYTSTTKQETQIEAASLVAMFMIPWVAVIWCLIR